MTSLSDRRLTEQSEAGVVKVRGALTETPQGYEVTFGENTEPDAVLPLLAKLSLPVFKLDLSRTRVSSEALSTLAALRDLAVLDLSHTDLGDDAVDAVLKLPTGRYLIGIYHRVTEVRRSYGRDCCARRVIVSRTGVFSAAVRKLRASGRA